MSKKVQYGLIAVVVAIIFVLTANIIRSCTERRKVDLEQQIAYIADQIAPMEFEITKKTESEIKLKIMFYDLEGNKIGTDSIKLLGSELNFDFQVFKLSDKSFLCFPYSLYSDKIDINNAIKLTDFYNQKDFPKIYAGIVDIKDEKGKKIDSASKAQIQETLKIYFSIVNNNQTEFDAESQSIVVHDIKNVNQFEKGFTYSVKFYPHTGSVQIIRKQN